MIFCFHLSLRGKPMLHEGVSCSSGPSLLPAPAFLGEYAYLKSQALTLLGFPLGRYFWQSRQLHFSLCSVIISMREAGQVLKWPLGLDRMGGHLGQRKGSWGTRTLVKKGGLKRNRGLGGSGQRRSKQRGHFNVRAMFTSQVWSV